MAKLWKVCFAKVSKFYILLLQRKRGSKLPIPPAVRTEREATKVTDSEQNGSASTTGPAVPIMLSEAKSLSTEEQELGVKGIREVFPDIHQSVAELTLKVCGHFEVS